MKPAVSISSCAVIALALGGCAQGRSVAAATPPGQLSLAQRCPDLTAADRAAIELDPANMNMNQSYAREYCVTMAEAERRMAIQASNVAGTLMQRISTAEAATFAGLWIEHRPEYRVKVAFTRDAAATLARYTGDPLFVPVERPGPTLIELRAGTSRVAQDLEMIGSRFNMASANEQTGRGEVALASDLEPVRQAQRDGRIRIPDFIDLVPPPPFKVTVPPPYPGGAARLAAFPRAKFRRSGISLLTGSGKVQPYVRDGCLVVDVEDSPVTILWPNEAQPDLSRNGVIEIVDRTNGEKFALGDAIAVDGGGLSDIANVPAIDESARCPAPYFHVPNFEPWARYEAGRNQWRAETLARDRQIPLDEAKRELAAMAQYEEKLRAFGQDLSNGSPDRYGGLVTADGRATLYWVLGDDDRPLVRIPPALKDRVTIVGVPRPVAPLIEERAVLRRQLSAAGLKAEVGYEIEKGHLTMGSVRDLPALAKAAREGMVVLPDSIDILTEGASVSGSYSNENGRRAEAPLLALPDFAAIMALARETPVDPTLAGGAEGGQPRLLADAQAREAAIMLVTMGFTQAKVVALRKAGLDPVTAWLAQNGRSTPVNRAILSRHVVIVEPVSVDSPARLGDGYRSSARVRVVETLKGPAKVGDTLNLRLASGFDPDGKWQQDNEEPMLLEGLPHAFAPGTRWLLWLPDGLYERVARFAGNTPAPGKWYKPWFSMAQVGRDSLSAARGPGTLILPTRYDDRYYALEDIRRKLATVRAAFAPLDEAEDGLVASQSGSNTILREEGMLALGIAKATEQTVHAGKPICLSYAIENSGMIDPPPDLVAAIGKQLGVDAHPGTSCGFSAHPFIKASGETAMLYSIRYTQEKGSTWLLRASAVYGSLGAQGQSYRLRKTRRGWQAEATGERWIS